MAGPDIKWEGASGTTYGHWIRPIGTGFENEAGNYIYAKKTEANGWQPVYVGQTSSLRDRLVDPEKEACATRNGATHIHAHTSGGGEDKRLAEQFDLIKKWNPVCND